MNGNGRLYRSTSDGMLGGVAAGIGHYFKIDPTNGGTNGAAAAGSPETPQTYGQAQLPQGGSTARTRAGLDPRILIAVGAFFLLANFGLFRAIHWGMWWPIVLIGLGFLLLSRRNQ